MAHEHWRKWHRLRIQTVDDVECILPSGLSKIGRCDEDAKKLHSISKTLLEVVVEPTIFSSSWYMALPQAKLPLAPLFATQLANMRSSAAVNGIRLFREGCAAPTGRITPTGGPAGYFSVSSSRPFSTESWMNFQEIVPGAAFLRA